MIRESRRDLIVGVIIFLVIVFLAAITTIARHNIAIQQRNNIEAERATSHVEIMFATLEDVGVEAETGQE